MKWSFFYNSFVKLPLYYTIGFNNIEAGEHMMMMFYSLEVRFVLFVCFVALHPRQQELSLLG